MRFCLTLSSFVAVLLASCSQYQSTCITSMADLPLKTTELPGDRWQAAPLRANAQHVLFGANSQKEKELRIGDYYFLRWYDAEPSKPVKVEMLYTQALTGADVLTRTVEHNEPRESAGERKETFHFSGPERAKRGDVMTWKVNLYCDGKLVDSLQSYLWE